ncbi:MAG TPA: hypothetical protein VLW50_29670 [Streptosporangiaceae bacterium]|nr:hypothetical protein [Streptosporangiaceae bacterium]
MNAAEMPARDLVLRLCASEGEFRRDWLAGTGGSSVGTPKRVVPLAVPPGVDPELADAIAGAATEMGARRLLACRTRAAFMYDSVTVLPANARALLDLAARWGHLDDFLVCLPDGSAAVLVSMAGYALGAGPPEFVAALAGPDVTRARERFAEWARATSDQRLRLVAGRYGGGPASCRATRRTQRPDMPERLSALAATVRRHGVRTAILRTCRAAVGWGAVALIVITLLSAPRASHVLPVLGGTVWLVFQVFVLARTHTLSWAACLRVIAAGAACAVAIVAVEWLAAGGSARPGWAASAGPAEELAALIPVAVFWLASRHRFTRLAATDFVLLGVASGAGFALVQGTIAALAAPGAGWHLAALLPGWTDAGPVRFPGHAVETGLVTAGIGLAVLARPRVADGAAVRWRPWRLLAWALPVALLGMAMLDHYHYDAEAAGLSVPLWVARLHAAVGEGHASRWLLLVLLATAVAVDLRAQQRVVDLVPPLPGVPRWASLARTARGSVISARLRRPRRSLRCRLARRLAMARAAAAEATVAVCHELAFLLVVLVAARPRGRPGNTFAASLAFARQRRELAMREARAAGQARRDVPGRAALWAAWRRLTATLALGGPAVFAVMLPLATRHLGKPRPWALPASPRQVTSDLRPGELASGLTMLHAWFGQFITAGQVLIVAAGLGVLILLTSGWTAPVPLLSRRDTGPPGRAVRYLAAVPAPGQFVCGVLRLGGELLPPATVQLLHGTPVTRPYQHPQHAQQALPPVGPRPATPQSAAVHLEPARRSTRADELGRSGWLFPPDTVRRWLGHAPEFGVGSKAPNGEPTDPAKLTADLISALRQIAGAASSLCYEDVTFRNHPAQAVVDRVTGAAVFFTPAGEFTGCALLTEEQLFRLVTEQRL